MKYRTALEDVFSGVAKNGTYMTVRDTDYQFEYGIVDSFTIVRETDDAVWVMLKAGGYNNGMQYISLLKIVAAATPNGVFTMTDSRGRVYELRSLEGNEIASWQKWLRYKYGNAGNFKRADADLLIEYTQAAKEWKDEN